MILNGNLSDLVVNIATASKEGGQPAFAIPLLKYIELDRIWEKMVNR